MRICYIGCLELNHFQRMIKWFAAKGHEVHVVTFTTYIPENFNYPNIHVHGVPASFSPFLWFFPKRSLWSKIGTIRKIIKKISPDIVHGHFLTEFGFYTAFSGNCPKVLTLTGSDVYINWKRSKIIKFTNKIALKNIDLVISHSNHMTQELISSFKVSKHKIKTRTGGIDLNTFNPFLQQKTENKINTVISIRNLKPIYNVELLIKAIPFVLNECPHVKFTIVGEGPEKSKLQQLVKQLKISKNVDFLGMVKYSEIPTWLASSNIYVSTSLSDGASASLFEAMACGSFPIVTDIPANRAWIINGENGFLVPTDDPKALANKIISAIKNDKLRVEAKEVNWQLIKKKADRENNMKMIENLYHQLGGQMSR